MEQLTMSLCLKNLAPTQYSNFNFNSMTKFRGKFLGQSSGGLFQLDSGADDNGEDIVALFELAKTDFGSPNPKKVIKVIFGYEGDGQLMATITSDDSVSISGMLPATQVGQEQHGDWSVGRSLGRYLSIRIQNVVGSDFSIDQIDIVAIVSSFRRLTR